MQNGATFILSTGKMSSSVVWQKFVLIFTKLAYCWALSDTRVHVHVCGTLST